MGISESPDIFLENISDLMQHLEYAQGCLDDLLALISIQADHLKRLKEVPKCLCNLGQKIKVRMHLLKVTYSFLGVNLNNHSISLQTKLRK